MAHDRLGACEDPLGLTGAEARSSWKVWRELCWTTDDEHRFTCGMTSKARNEGVVFALLFFVSLITSNIFQMISEGDYVNWINDPNFNNGKPMYVVNINEDDNEAECSLLDSPNRWFKCDELKPHAKKVEGGFRNAGEG